jgi:ABC-type nitrate/sulfonate/bicarbonate transport system permease component
MRLRMILPVLTLLVAWELISRRGVVDKVLFPAPSQVATALAEMAMSGELWRDVQSSLSRLIAGVVFGVAAGVGLGLITGRIAVVSDIVSPVITLFRPLPPVAIIPLIIVWLGIGEPAKIFSIAFAVFFPVWLNTHAGARQIPQKYLWSAATLTRSRVRTFLLIIFPASLPFVTAGIRLGISVAFVMVFVAELAGASSGIGYEIATSHLSYRIDRMIAGLVVLGIAGALTDFLFVRGLYRACPWLKFTERP